MLTKDARARLRDVFEQLQRLDREIEDRSRDRAGVMRAARTEGFDVKIIRLVLQRRLQDPNDLAERERILDLYEKALDALGDDA